MPVATVRVPAGQVKVLRTALVELYAIEAESIHQAVEGCLSDGEPLDSPLAHREELFGLDRLLTQVGWGSLSASAQDIELSGDRQLLSCALHAALIELGDRVSEGCDECWRGERTTDELRKPARGVLELLSALDSLDHPIGQGTST